jgi:5-methyltetrahydropteroyltriglutamate--homocysteine methyltransferase
MTEPRSPARAEIVGSLLKPARLYAQFERVYSNASAATALDAAHRAGLAELIRVAEEEIRRVVERQIACGLDVISDGELRRALFTNSFYDAIDGVEVSPDPVPFVDETGAVLNYEGPPMIARRLRKTASPAAEEVRFLRGITDYPSKVTFPAGSWFCLPYLFKEGVTDRAYADREAMVGHALVIQRQLVREAVEAGATYIQFDWPAYAILVDEHWRAMMQARWGITPERLLEQALAADRAMVEGLPEHVTTALHFCRGNWKSRWITQGPLDFVAEPMFALPYDAFLIEWEDAAREGDFSTLRAVPREGPVVVLGVISTKQPQLESEDAVLRRIDDANRYLDLERLALSPQCGFASVWHGNLLTEDDQWRKLELLGRVADRVWPR